MNKILAFIGVAATLAACNNNRGWSSVDRTDFIKGCYDEAKVTFGEEKAKSYCECMQPVMEKKYPTVGEAKKITEAEMKTPQMQAEAQKCFGGGINDNNTNNNNTNNNNGGVNTNNNENNGNNTGSTWTSMQRQTFLQGCTGSYQQSHNSTQDQANSYCSCMITKLEQKFSYDEANRLTTQDFQSPDWQKAIMECMPQDN